MKKSKTALGMFVAFMFLVTLMTSQSSAQLLDGAWFKLKCKFKTHTVDTTTETMKKNNFKRTVYAHFKRDNDHYNIEYWYIGVYIFEALVWEDWALASTQETVSSCSSKNGNEILLYGPDFDLYRDIKARLFPRVKVTNNKTIIKGTGACEIDDDPHYSYGYVQVSGKRVTESQLPLPPP